MALLSIVFGRLPGLSQKAIGFLPVDVFTEETVTLTSEVTSHPVETGSLITDHIKTDPIGLRVRGVVRGSNRSIGYNILQTLHQMRQPVFVVTGLQTFTNMAITRLEIPREVRTADSLQFTAEFKKITFATTQTSQAEAGGGAEDTATGTSAAGSGTTTPATPAQAASVDSTIDATGGPAPASTSGSLLSRAFGGA
ncbi:MAG: hypothetical protein KJP02_05775 [Octadecabacter sp.]|nr:hypothetical protein [Octadecabacter sp.]